MNSQLKDLTLIIPTYNRHEFVIEQFDFWYDYHVNLLVLDGSRAPIELGKLKSIPSRYQYIHAPTSFISRLANHNSKIRTKYAAILFDDEKFYVEGLIKAVRILDQNIEINNVSGQVLGFKNLGKDLYLLDMYSEFINANLTEKDPEQRILQHLSPYRMSTLCSVSRTCTLQKSLTAIRYFEFIPVPTIFEICFEIANVSHGKSVVMENVFWMRNCNNQPQWNQGAILSLIEWWNQGGSKIYYSTLQNVLDTEKDLDIKRLLNYIDFGLKEFVRVEVDKVTRDLGLGEVIYKRTKMFVREIALKFISEKTILDLKIVYRKYFNVKRSRYRHWGSINEIVAENGDEDSLILRDFLLKINNSFSS